MERVSHLCERTGPDFMHPMYTRGLDRCLTNVSPSVPVAKDRNA